MKCEAAISYRSVQFSERNEKNELYFNSRFQENTRNRIKNAIKNLTGQNYFAEPQGIMLKNDTNKCNLFPHQQHRHTMRELRAE